MGPVDQAELIAKIRSGAIAPGDLVWREGLADWTACGNVLELAPAFHAAPVAAVPRPGEVSPYAPPQARGGLPAPAAGAGKATASLVLGVVSVVFGMTGLMCCPGAFVALPCGVLAVIFASQAFRLALQYPLPGSALSRAKAGQILGWIGAVISGLWFLLLIAGSI